jgi:hypothetical protein
MSIVPFESPFSISGRGRPTILGVEFPTYATISCDTFA